MSSVVLDTSGLSFFWDIGWAENTVPHIAVMFPFQAVLIVKKLRRVYLFLVLSYEDVLMRLLSLVNIS